MTDKPTPATAGMRHLRSWTVYVDGKRTLLDRLVAFHESPPMLEFLARPVNPRDDGYGARELRAVDWMDIDLEGQVLRVWGLK